MGTRLLTAGLFGLLALPLFLLTPDAHTLQGLALQKALGSLQEDLPESFALRSSQGEPLADTHRDALRSLRPGREVQPTEDGLGWQLGSGGPNLSFQVEDHLLGLSGDEGQTLGLPTHVGNRIALIPPLLAILMAFLFRRTQVALFLGVLLGCFLLVPKGDPFPWALQIFAVDILWERVFTSSFEMYILAFVVLLSAMVAVMTRMGAIEGMVRSLVRFAKTPRSAQGVAYGLGLGIFFDDYANTIVVGNSTGPLFDRLKVSRAKLAYIVDSTAAPMAGLAVLSTWVAYQISTYSPQLPLIGYEESQGYALFLETIPFRFYCIFALTTVGFVILSRRDFGPMWHIEQAARRGDEVISEASTSGLGKFRPAPWVSPRWENGVLPLLTLLFFTGWRLYDLGAQSVLAEHGQTYVAALQSESTMTWLRAVLNATDSSRAIFDGSLAAFLLACALALFRRQLGPKEIFVTAGKGSLALSGALSILILAWSIGAVCEKLDTAGYLVAVAGDLANPAWLPAILFMTACFVAFATGSSWATMAILQPNVVLLADRLGEFSSLGSHGLLILCIGAVLEGAIFGDHCSPISDTTILSSAASRCRHIEHVRTQAPYAILCACVALLFGYFPASFLQWSPVLSLLLGTVFLILFLFRFGKRVNDLAPAAAQEPS